MAEQTLLDQKAQIVKFWGQERQRLRGVHDREMEAYRSGKDPTQEPYEALRPQNYPGQDGGEMKSEVEQFKLTPQQMSFQKKYKQLKMKQSLLEGVTLKEQERFRTLKSLWGELTGEFDKLQAFAPEEPMETTEGMKEGTAPAMDKRWNIEY